MPTTPEALAREIIDEQLAAAGWLVQDRAAMNRMAALGIAVREYPLATGPCDYLLLVAGKACGVIEAKSAGTTLSGITEQARDRAAWSPRSHRCAELHLGRRGVSRREPPVTGGGR